MFGGYIKIKIMKVWPPDYNERYLACKLKTFIMYIKKKVDAVSAPKIHFIRATTIIHTCPVVVKCRCNDCLITPYIRMLDSDRLNSRDIFFFFFINSGLALWICRIFTSCSCVSIKFNFFSWYLQNRICRFYPSPRRL